MEVILYTNNSDNKKVGKSLSVQATINGTLREGCSMVDPVIQFSDSVVNNAIAAASNYAKIADFGRYYYITDIICVGKFWEVHMHCDVIEIRFICFSVSAIQICSLSCISERRFQRDFRFFEDPC